MLSVSELKSTGSPVPSLSAYQPSNKYPARPDEAAAAVSKTLAAESPGAAKIGSINDPPCASYVIQKPVSTFGYSVIFSASRVTDSTLLVKAASVYQPVIPSSFPRGNSTSARITSSLTPSLVTITLGEELPSLSLLLSMKKT